MPKALNPGPDHHDAYEVVVPISIHTSRLDIEFQYLTHRTEVVVWSVRGNITFTASAPFVFAASRQGGWAGFAIECLKEEMRHPHSRIRAVHPG